MKLDDFYDILALLVCAITIFMIGYGLIYCQEWQWVVKVFFGSFGIVFAFLWSLTKLRIR